MTPRISPRGRGWRWACRAGRWAGAWAGRAVVGGGRRGGGWAPGRVVGRANAKGGGPSPDMDKLKKVLSGQDTEDRSGLSEVSAAGEVGISWKAVLLSSRPRRRALLGHSHRWQRGALCGRRGSRTLSNIPSEGLGALKTSEVCGVGVWAPGPPDSPHPRPARLARESP